MGFPPPALAHDASPARETSVPFLLDALPDTLLLVGIALALGAPLFMATVLGRGVAPVRLATLTVVGALMAAAASFALGAIVSPVGPLGGAARVIVAMQAGALVFASAFAWQARRAPDERHAWLMRAAGATFLALLLRTTAGHLLDPEADLASAAQHLLMLVAAVHAAAGLAWLGGLATWVALWDAERLEGLAPAFARLALPALLVVAGAGALLAVTHLPRVDALWTSIYGRILAAKSLLLVAAAAMARWHARRGRARLDTLIVEAMLVMGIVILAALLALVPTPS